MYGVSGVSHSLSHPPAGGAMPPMPPMPAGGAIPAMPTAPTAGSGAAPVTKAATVDNGTSAMTTSGDDAKGARGASSSATSVTWYSTSGRHGGGATAASISSKNEKFLNRFVELSWECHESVNQWIRMNQDEAGALSYICICVCIYCIMMYYIDLYWFMLYSIVFALILTTSIYASAFGQRHPSWRLRFEVSAPVTLARASFRSSPWQRADIRQSNSVKWVEKSIKF